MPKVALVKQDGSQAGDIELNAAVFGIEPNTHVLREAVIMQRASLRKGTHAVKNRSQVSGGGKKPWRQKGTGRARHGSIRSPQWVGGGVSHGPIPHGHSKRVPKKMKAAALRGALSDRARSGKIHVVSAVVDGDVPSTKAAARLLASLDAGRAVLVVVTRDDAVGAKSLRNIPGVHLLLADQ